MSIHQPKHFDDERLPIGRDGLDEQLANQGIQRRLMSFGVGSAGFECLVVQGEGNVFHSETSVSHVMRPRNKWTRIPDRITTEL